MNSNKRVLTSVIAGLAGIGMLVMPQGCGSSGSGGSGGSGGSAGAGGAGHGGSGGGAGGTTGTGGGAGGQAGGCTASNTMTAPTSGLIADFMGDGGIEIMGRLDPYPSTGGPMVDTSAGNLKITANIAPVASPSNQYTNGVSLSLASCIDASAFTGVQFSIAGTISGCTIAYATVDSEHQQMTNNPFGTAATGDYAATTTLTVPTATVMVPFPTTGSGAMPANPLDKMKIIQLNFGLVIPPPAADAGTGDGGAANCAVNVTIDDIKFY